MVGISYLEHCPLYICHKKKHNSEIIQSTFALKELKIDMQCSPLLKCRLCWKSGVN